jgi:hypothetical protein
MAKSIQCPACGNKHPVTSLPDAPSFRCDQCGQSLKIPAQFRPSMDAARHSPSPSAPRGGDATAVLPDDRRQAPGAAAAAAPAAAPARSAVKRPAAVAAGGANAIPRRWRAVAWAVALPLGLVVTIWLGRITDWLSGDHLVDIFTGTGFTRYIRIVAIAPVWALFTALFLTLLLEGGQALARRRAEHNGAGPGLLRRRARPVESDDTGGRDRPADAGDGQRARTAARRGSAS